jgi:hypothetical protein
LNGRLEGRGEGKGREERGMVRAQLGSWGVLEWLAGKREGAERKGSGEDAEGEEERKGK